MSTQFGAPPHPPPGTPAAWQVLPYPPPPAARRGQGLAEGIQPQDPCACFETTMARAYADETRARVVVVTAAKLKRPADAGEQASLAAEVMRGFLAGATEGGASFGPVAAADPGSLGGTVSCAPFTTAATAGRVCVAVDGASVVAVMETDSSGPVQSVPNAVREAVVHRT